MEKVKLKNKNNFKKTIFHAEIAEGEIALRGNCPERERERERERWGLVVLGILDTSQKSFNDSGIQAGVLPALQMINECNSVRR